VVQIGTVNDITKAVPANFSNGGKPTAGGKPVQIAPANGNGNGHANAAEKAAEAVAGD
jgi:hypothetical protein